MCVDSCNARVSVKGQSAGIWEVLTSAQICADTQNMTERSERRVTIPEWDLADRLRAAVQEEMNHEIETTLETGLNSYHSAIMDAIDKATTATYARFDKITDLLMGEDRRSKAKGAPTLMEVAELVKEGNG